MKENIDPYMILRIPCSATASEIKKAFLLLARKYHPDQNKGSKLSEKRFQQINLAYQILSHPERRKAFDAKVLKTKSKPDGLRPELLREKGMDLSLSLSVSLEELFLEKPLSMHYFQPLGGKQKKSRILLKLPKGALHGTKLKFPGRGGAMGRKVTGDLYVRIQMKPHPLFKWKGRDIFLDFPLSVFDAMTLKEVKIPTLTGQAVLKLPLDIQSEEWLRLKGLGLFKSVSGDRGDMFVRLLPEYPKGLEAEAKRDIKIFQNSGSGAAFAALRKKYEGLFPQTERRQRAFFKLFKIPRGPPPIANARFSRGLSGSFLSAGGRTSQFFHKRDNGQILV